MHNIKKRWLIVAMVMGLLMLLLLSGCGKDASQKETDETGGKDAFVLLSTKEEQGVKTFTTIYGSFSYPTEFAKDVVVEASTKGGIPTITFSLDQSELEATLFTIRYGGREGIPFGTYQASADVEPITVYVSFSEAPENFSAEDRRTFEMAQEIFNDVIASMEENSEFSGI